MIDLFSVHEDAATVSAVFQQAAPGIGNDGGALAGDPRVGQRKVISRFILSAGPGRGTGEWHHTAGTVRGNNFESVLADGFDTRHKVARSRDYSMRSRSVACCIPP